ncbi:MAG: transposase [Bacteroidia bacterium]|nr:transposase [Bacteroidia bacterium]
MTYGKYYHILNRGVNRQNIFVEKDDYEHFFRLMSIFIEPIADIYAYAAMPNHFHFALRIKEEDEIAYLNPDYAKSEELDKKWRTYSADNLSAFEQSSLKKPVPHKMMQHFCSAYAKGINTKNKRTGPLFEHPYKRIIVDNEAYLKRLILYIHNNPVKHGFSKHASDYPWTSYLSLISIKTTKLSRKAVLGYFDSKANFISQHKVDDNFEDIDFLFLE